MKQNSWARIAVILLCALLFVGVLVVNALAGAGRGEMRRTRLKTFWGFFFFICYALISACCLHNIDTLETLRKVMKEERGGLQFGSGSVGVGTFLQEWVWHQTQFTVSCLGAQTPNFP